MSTAVQFNFDQRRIHEQRDQQYREQIMRIKRGHIRCDDPFTRRVLFDPIQRQDFAAKHPVIYEKAEIRIGKSPRAMGKQILFIRRLDV